MTPHVAGDDDTPHRPFSALDIQNVIIVPHSE